MSSKRKSIFDRVDEDVNAQALQEESVVSEASNEIQKEEPAAEVVAPVEPIAVEPQPEEEPPVVSETVSEPEIVEVEPSAEEEPEPAKKVTTKRIAKGNVAVTMSITEDCNDLLDYLAAQRQENKGKTAHTIIMNYANARFGEAEVQKMIAKQRKEKSKKVEDKFDF